VLVGPQHLSLDPARIQFSYGPHGKPALDDQEARLEFNVSHSGSIALIALARGRKVGVDVERHRTDVLDDRITERYFSPLECAALRALPASVRVEGFFNCWSRKEAYIKACGRGLSLPLKDFQVSLAPGEEAALLWARDSEESLRGCVPGPGYAGAVAAQGHGWSVGAFEWRRTANLPR
jgi:4'-phosphopantetheinyl transferase